MSSTERSNMKEGLIDLTAGSLGGIAVVYVGQPLDTVKVKMQTFPLLYGNMVDCVKNTILTEGISKGLYAGTVPALICNVAENSILFFSYGFCQKCITHIKGVSEVSQLTSFNNACAGSMASFFSTLVISPTELIKCKLQAVYETKGNKSSMNINSSKLMREIINKEGLKGLYRGFVPTVLREMPGYFFFFGGYEGTRTILASGHNKDDIGLVKTMIAGGVGGALFWSSTYPIDVAKSRIQIKNNSDSLINLIIKIAKNEGLSALYHGLTPTLVRTIPATAALFVTYEYSKKLLNYLSSD